MPRLLAWVPEDTLVLFSSTRSTERGAEGRASDGEFMSSVTDTQSPLVFGKGTARRRTQCGAGAGRGLRGMSRTQGEEERPRPGPVAHPASGPPIQRALSPTLTAPAVPRATHCPQHRRQLPSTLQKLFFEIQSTHLSILKCQGFQVPHPLTVPLRSQSCPGAWARPCYRLSQALHIPPSEHRTWSKKSLPVL